MYTLAHLSDWHTTSPNLAGPAAFLNKRFFGWLSWNTRRHTLYKPEVFEALLEDIALQAPDHFAVTGDLTNVGLEHEFVATRALLDRLGTPERVSVIPGNHDAYVSSPPPQSWDHWAPYLRGDSGVASGGEERAPVFDEYPVLWLRDSIAIVGLCTAVPTPLFQASGWLGASQLEATEKLLEDLGDRGLFRVLLVHHPVCDSDMSQRRRLRDSRGLREVLSRSGAELVLHGHVHRTLVRKVKGPSGEVPIVGVRSASYGGAKESKRAQYHLYRIESEGSGFRLRADVRGYDRTTRRFVADGELAL